MLLLKNIKIMFWFKIIKVFIEIYVLSQTANRFYCSFMRSNNNPFDHHVIFMVFNFKHHVEEVCTNVFNIMWISSTHICVAYSLVIYAKKKKKMCT